MSESPVWRAELIWAISQTYRYLVVHYTTTVPVTWYSCRIRPLVMVSVVLDRAVNIKLTTWCDNKFVQSSRKRATKVVHVFAC